MKLLLLLLLALLLPGCATLLNDPVVKNDMASTVANLKQAAKLGYIAENDPALVCALAIEAKATVDASFAPQIDGVISLGSVAYIAKRMAEKGVQLPMECDAVIGRVVIDGAKTVRRSVIPGLLR